MSHNELQLSVNVYEEDLNDDRILDLSSKNLKILPDLNNDLICVLYLQNNLIAKLQEDFFSSLPSLMYLDLRNNLLTDIPKSIKKHSSLTHLLLQNNNITTLPNEMGTVSTLKVLQLNGNPLTYPPKDITMGGTLKVLAFLHEKFIEENSLETQSMTSESQDCIFSEESRSYNSVLDQEKPNAHKTLSVQFSEKETESEEDYSKIKKCPKLPKCRSKTLGKYSQSSKYLKPVRIGNKQAIENKMKENFLKGADLKKHQEFIAARDKVLQERKNIELLREWRQNYRHKQLFLSNDNTLRLVPRNYPYDTNPEYMTLLSREDIEKDLPDKYRKKLFRRSKPSVPRRDNTDVHLAMKIKQLFQNLEAIDLNRESMTPRTEQKALLGEIHKITEIKQKLKELSSSNVKSVYVD